MPWPLPYHPAHEPGSPAGSGLTSAAGVSELGLVQMTRKKVSEGLLEAFSEVCDKCNGRGIILVDLDT